MVEVRVWVGVRVRVRGQFSSGAIVPKPSGPCQTSIMEICTKVVSS